LTGIGQATTFYVATDSNSHSCAQAQNPATLERNFEANPVGAIPRLSVGDMLYT
jgi:hypothetical protein